MKRNRRQWSRKYNCRKKVRKQTSNEGLKGYRKPIMLIIGFSAITGIGIVDDIIWRLVFSIIGAITFIVVRKLYDFHFIRSKKDGQIAYENVFIIVLFVVLFLASELIKVY